MMYLSLKLETWEPIRNAYRVEYRVEGKRSCRANGSIHINIQQLFFCFLHDITQKMYWYSGVHFIDLKAGLKNLSKTRCFQIGSG